MTTKQTVLDFFSAENEEQAARHAYKYTDCGMWLQFKEDGVRMGSIVEGSDTGTQTYTLRYADNFTSADIQARIDAIEAEADAVWKWANEVDPVTDKTAADEGFDCPDVWRDYRHLNPDT